uniref:Uncharacterized protein n=1 Tax=Oryza rufipogon TaxID=4529 RepID=A0A0E0NWW3_ORYRU
MRMQKIEDLRKREERCCSYRRMANFRVYYGNGEIMSNEMGVDLSNFSQCTLYHPNPDNLRMPEVWYWLTCSFSLDPQVYSVNSVMELFGHRHPMATERSNPKSIMKGLVARLQTSRIQDGHVGASLSKEGSTKQFIRSVRYAGRGMCSTECISCGSLPA